jgi:hypothetical protein
VIVQDPIWEQSFPDVSGVVVPFAAADGSGVTLAALTGGEARALRETNERRWDELLHGLRALDMDPVVVDSDEPRDVVSSFLSWADQRLFTRGRA